MTLFRYRLKVITLFCRRCGAPIRVLARSAAARERTCNLCIYSEARRRDADAATLLNLR